MAVPEVTVADPEAPTVAVPDPLWAADRPDLPWAVECTGPPWVECPQDPPWAAECTARPEIVDAAAACFPS